MRAVELGLAPSEHRNDFSVTFWQRVRRSSSASRSLRPREPFANLRFGFDGGPWKILKVWQEGAKALNRS
jgi:hypothetical protein